MRLRQGGLARLRLDHRDGVTGREIGQHRLGPGMDHAAPADDHRRARRPDRLDRAGQLARIGRGAADMPDPRREERLGPIMGLGLHILAEGQADRPAFRRVGHHPHRAGQRAQQMLGPRDAVEIAHHGAETVIRADRAVTEILDLLQHRIGAAVGIDIARDQQQRQPVHMGDRGGGDHVRGARPDAGRHGLRAPAPMPLGKGDGGMGHGLLVLPAPCRQGVARLLQRLPQPRHVAMPEDRPDPVDEPLPLLGHLHRQPAHHRLRRGQPHRLTHALPLLLHENIPRGEIPQGLGGAKPPCRPHAASRAASQIAHSRR